MANAKDCPLCGSAMSRITRSSVDRVPGTDEAKTRNVTEWVCPDCDYFEEEDGDRN